MQENGVPPFDLTGGSAVGAEPERYGRASVRQRASSPKAHPYGGKWPLNATAYPLRIFSHFRGGPLPTLNPRKNARCLSRAHSVPRYHRCKAIAGCFGRCLSGNGCEGINGHNLLHDLGEPKRHLRFLKGGILGLGFVRVSGVLSVPCRRKWGTGTLVGETVR